MARVAGIYSVPAGTDGVPDQTVDSSKYNAFIHDVESDLNTPRPISAGGTGANSAAGALAALGGETAAQLVADYSTFVFAAGSFYSAAGANAAPTAAAFQGICYANPAGTELYLEGRELATNATWYRRKTAGVWGAWAQDTALDATKVAKAGDTMTGNLIIAPAAGNGSLTIAPGAAGSAALLQLNKPGNTGDNRIAGASAALGQWMLHLGDAAQRYSIDRYVAGVLTDTPFYIDPADGRMYTAGVAVTQPNQLATKAYADAAATPSTVAPLIEGTAAVGVATKYAREDHVHPASGITALTGDVAAAGPSGSQAATLATVNANVGSFGSLTAIPVVTVNAKGLVTAVSTVAASGWKLLNTLTASNSATLTDTTSLTATYNEYEVVFDNIVPVTNNTQLQLRVRLGGVLQTGTVYHWAGQILCNITANNLVAGSGGGGTSVPLCASGGSLGIGSGATGWLNGFLRMFRPAGTTNVRTLQGTTTIINSICHQIWTFTGGLYGAGTTAVDGLEFSMVAGNIASGVIRIYGR